MSDPTAEEVAAAMDSLLLEIAAYTEQSRQLRLARAHYELGEPLSMAAMTFPLWRLLTMEETDGA